MRLENGLTMLGGLALFLYGMRLMKEGLVKGAGSRLENLLKRCCQNLSGAVLVGTFVTALLQSSSAVTVMVVGFVDAGWLQLEQAAGIIMGANVGTTVTSWLLGLAEWKEAPVLLRLLSPTALGPLTACVGVGLLLVSRREQIQNAAAVLVGFSILLFGMHTMSGAAAPLAQNPCFVRMLAGCSHPLKGVVLGALVTALLQSSSASVGILQALCGTGAVTVGSAIPIVMGQNIGTCVTALLSGIGAGGNAGRAALLHLYLNVLGTALCMTALGITQRLFSFPVMQTAATPMGIAAIHSLFNVIVTVCFLPFTSQLVALVRHTGRSRIKTFWHLQWR